jgi:hypothetical protein
VGLLLSASQTSLQLFPTDHNCDPNSPVSGGLLLNVTGGLLDEQGQLVQ